MKRFRLADEEALGVVNAVVAEQIERLLAQHPQGLTTGELAREFGVDASTIFRDLAILESMGTGLIKEKRRYILDHRRSLHSVKHLKACASKAREAHWFRQQ